MKQGAALILAACLPLAGMLSVPALSLAQTVNLLGNPLTLSLSPPNPTPNGRVRVSARSSLIDLSETRLAWYVDGAKRLEGEGETVFDITAPPLGSVTDISLSVSEGSVEIARSSLRIRPTELDLLWESDSFTPPFFRGRALPSEGTRLSLEAIPRFVRTDGSTIPVSEIFFTWKRNGYVVQGERRGLSRITIPAPPLFGADTISVEARTTDNTYSGTASVVIPSVEPTIVLYEKHPLFGIMYHQALSAEVQLPKAEASFSAVPYFAEASRANDPNLVYEWEVNRNLIQNDPSRPNEITIDARDSSGIAQIDVGLSHVTNFFLGAFRSWGVTFLGEGGRGFNDLFTGEGGL